MPADYLPSTEITKEPLDTSQPDLTQLTRCCLKLAFGFPACDRDSPALPAATRRAKEWQRTTRTFRSRRSPHSAQPHSRPAAARLSVV